MENQLLALFQKTGDIRAYLLWKAAEAAREPSERPRTDPPERPRTDPPAVPPAEA